MKSEILKIWNADLTEADKDQLYVKLKKHEKNDDIAVIAVDWAGNRIESGTILSIDNEYKVIVLQDDVNPRIPLKTDIWDCPLVYPLRELKKEIASRQVGIPLSREVAEKIAKALAGDKQETEH